MCLACLACLFLSAIPSSSIPPICIDRCQTFHWVSSAWKKRKWKMLWHIVCVCVHVCAHVRGCLCVCVWPSLLVSLLMSMESSCCCAWWKKHWRGMERETFITVVLLSFCPSLASLASIFSAFSFSISALIKSNQMYLYSPSYISWYLKVLYRNPA